MSAGETRPLADAATIRASAARMAARRRPVALRILSCIGRPLDDRHGLSLTRWVFLRCLGVVYLLAFASLLPQILGLVGHDGILPAQDLLRRIAQQVGAERYWQLPTLCWFNASDGFLRFLCIGGMALAGLLIFDVAPAIVLMLLWIVYLSLTNVGNVFLRFQWDALLLEAGLLAAFLAPLQLLPLQWLSRRGRVPPPPSAIAVWLLRWLLFRLMFLSGMVKLGSGDECWQCLTALCVHYETQPLSNWVAWQFHQLPLWFHKLSCAAMFLIEVGLPFFIFVGRRGRHVAFAGFVFLQTLIIVTGNYGFFNVLTLALCILLLDDGAWPEWLRRWFVRKGTSKNAWTDVRKAVRAGWRWPAWLLAPIGVVIVLLTMIPALHRLRVNVAWPEFVAEMYRAVAPFNSFNAYGLFAAMTHERPEVIVEGSEDGVTWKAYEFRYKPGDPQRAPPFVAPHMPRLDWQMWFAALGPVERSPWFFFFCKRLLEGAPPVLGLLEKNPFPDRPPRYVRGMLYDYRFTDRATRAADGRWWRRELKGAYCPPLDLEFFRRRGL